MKKKILLIVSAILVLGMGLVLFAYTSSITNSDRAMACCCCSGESCPMKTKDAAGMETAPCCDDCACCKEGSCPMKAKGDAAKTGAAGMENMAAGESCCSCCKDKAAKTGV